MATFSAVTQAALTDVINLLKIGQAVNLPLTEDVVQRISYASTDCGFRSQGQLYNDLRDRPIQTLLEFIQFAGT